MRLLGLLAGVLIVATCLLSASGVAAGVLTPSMQKQLAALPAGDLLTVLVVMQDQADIRSLDENLHASKAPLDRRHLAVVESLREVAAKSQSNLIASLNHEKSLGKILGYKSHWLINAIVVRGDAEAIIRLAKHPDVAHVEPNIEVELIGPVPGSAAEKSVLPGVGLVPGVAAIGAPRVWEELGITGEGALVGTLDTGVDGTHPALSSRWRGNFAPASECWLDAANLGSPDFPSDAHSHGTHVTGTVVGLAAGDTIGVAPGALWIASNGINAATNEQLDNNVLASLEWFTDPDGNPATMDDVPDVVQNSWGVNEGFLGYLDCDSRWWDAIDNCEAAGVLLIFSTGNEGPGSQSVRSPADRATTPYNCFSVGSTSAFYPFDLSSFSSRGPSGSECGPEEFRIKPEVCAPGSDIYSAKPGGGYQYLSGTSMAGPHVAGVVALMRSANPNIDVTTIKQVLMESARDLGDPGEDNQYGYGFIDAYAAVLSVIDGIGYVSGQITDTVSGEPITGVAVNLVGGYQNTTTDGMGNYMLTLPVGTHDLTAQVFGYHDGVVGVTVLDSQTSSGGVQLIPLERSSLSGRVLDAGGVPVSGATLEFLDVALPLVTTIGDGSYQVDLPRMYSFSIRAESENMGPHLQDVTLFGPTVLDFHLTVLDRDGFETGDFSANSWQHAGNEPWAVTGDGPYAGSFSARSGAIGDDGRSHLSIERHIVADGIMSFAVKTSSELSYDYLAFSVDGLEFGRWSGSEPWIEVAFPVVAGTHLFTWTYAKDASVTYYDDWVGIDNVTFPNNGAPVLVLSHDSLFLATVPNGSGIKHLVLSNDGPSTLRYDLGLFDGSVKKTAGVKEYSSLAKGEVDLRTDPQKVLDSGGPDGYGYSWADNESPAGPIYQWVELSGLGTDAGKGDDANLGPFPLGFSFSYYGAAFDSVRINTNGWVSFTSSSEAFANQGIPTLAEPNNLLAPFWTDLDASNSGSILYHHDPDHERFIIQWDQVPHYDSSITETFQLVLNYDGSLLFQYKDVGAGETCTVGMENGAGNDGLQVVFNGPYLENERAILFTSQPAVPWLSVAPGTGQIAPGDNVELDVMYSGNNLPEGYYGASIILKTNDPSAGERIIPVVLNVGAVSDVPDAVQAKVAVLLGAIPNPFNPSTEIRFILPEALVVELAVYDVSGRLVKTLFQGPCAAGDNAILWRGADEKGRSVASGTYFAHLRGSGINLVKSVTLIR